MYPGAWYSFHPLEVSLLAGEVHEDIFLLSEAHCSYVPLPFSCLPFSLLPLEFFLFLFLTLRELILAIYCLLSYLQCFIHPLLSARTDWRKCWKVKNSEWSTHLSWVLVKVVKYQENSPELTKWKPDKKQTSPEAWEPGQLLRYLFL